jgi:hypothetical protein
VRRQICCLKAPLHAFDTYSATVLSTIVSTICAASVWSVAHPGGHISPDPRQTPEAPPRAGASWLPYALSSHPSGFSARRGRMPSGGTSPNTGRRSTAGMPTPVDAHVDPATSGLVCIQSMLRYCTAGWQPRENAEVMESRRADAQPSIQQ